MNTGLGSLHRVTLIMDRRGWAGEIVNLVNFNKQGMGDIVAEHVEIRVAQQMGDVVASTGVKVVNAENLMAEGNQPFAEVRADEARASGDEDPLAGVGHSLVVSR